MSEEAKTAEAAPKKGKGKLIIIIAVVVVLLGGGAAAFLMKKNSAASEDGEEGAAESHATKTEHAVAPTYVKLDAFTTNLTLEPGGDLQSGQFIQVVMQLKVETALDGETMKSYSPEIRNVILRLLSSKKPSELTTTAGKDALAEQIMTDVNQIVNPSTTSSKKHSEPSGPVTAVLFDNFIIQ